MILTDLNCLIYGNGLLRMPPPLVTLTANGFYTNIARYPGLPCLPPGYDHRNIFLCLPFAL